MTHRAQELGPQPIELLEVGLGAGDALPERLVLPPQVVVTLQGSTSPARRGSILPGLPRRGVAPDHLENLGPADQRAAGTGAAVTGVRAAIVPPGLEARTGGEDG